MADMLVKLYTLPDITALVTHLREQHIIIRQADPADRYVLRAWVRQHFSAVWAVGCEDALTQRPISCYLAVSIDVSQPNPDNPYDLPPETLLGFACYDVASKGMFGPMGVHPKYQGQAIGTALLITSLHAMRAERYAYAVIGWAGPTDFYAKTVGATIIDGSAPGIFRGPLRGG